MTRRTSRSRPSTNEDGRVREVAVLADGPWAPRRYWRDDLEAMQHASRAMGYPDRHPSAVLRGYQPTDQHTFDGGPDSDQPARVWRYRPPATDSADAAAIPRQRGHADAPDTTRLSDRPARQDVEREQLRRTWHADDHNGAERAEPARSLW